MKKRQLLSIAALSAAFCTPVISSLGSLQAAQETTEPAAAITPDVFADTYLTSKVQTLLPDGSLKTETIWIESANADNAKLLSESKAVFEKMSAADQQIVLSSAKAHNIDYPALVAAAQSLLKEETPAPEAEKTSQIPASAADSAASAASSESSASSSEAAAQTSESSASSTQSETTASSSESSVLAYSQDSTSKAEETKKEENPETSQQPNADSSAKEANSSASSSSEQKAESKTDSSASSSKTDPSISEVQKDNQDKEETADSSSAKTSENADLEKEPQPGQKTEKPEAKPESVQTPVQPAQPVVYNTGAIPGGLYSTRLDGQVSDLDYAAAAAIARQAGLSDWVVYPVVYTYTGLGQPIPSQPYCFLQTPDKTIIYQLLSSDGNTLRVQYFNDNSCTFDAAINSLVLAGKSEAAFALSSEPQEAQPAPGIEEAIAPETASTSENVQSVQDIPHVEALGEQNAALTVPTVQPETTENTAQDGTVFINTYCYVQGGLIRQASAGNMQQILNGLAAWEALGDTTKTAVNEYLTSNGGISFQLLYRQANQIRLGLPVSSSLPAAVASSISRADSVNTGSASQMMGWMFGGAVSLGALLVLALDPTKKD